MSGCSASRDPPRAEASSELADRRGRLATGLAWFVTPSDRHARRHGGLRARGDADVVRRQSGRGGGGGRYRDGRTTGDGSLCQWLDRFDCCATQLSWRRGPGLVAVLCLNFVLGTMEMHWMLASFIRKVFSPCDCRSQALMTKPSLIIIFIVNASR